MSKPEATRVLAAICAAQWAITEDGLATVIGIAERSQSDLQAVLQARGSLLTNTEGVTMRDGVAVLPVRGPIFRYANMFTQISGATSIDALATDFGEAVNNPAVKAIVLEIDSPGGMVAGVSEFAAQVRDATKVKPVVAYISDTGASAAYWIAAAAGEVVARDTATVGSIGVVMQTRGTGKDGAIEFVSSQSPNKRMNPESETGARAIQAHVDALAQVFIESVAAYRGVSADTVQNDFGQGGVMVGADAVAAGLADRLGSLESIIAGLSGDNRMRAFAMTDKITRDTIAANYPDIAAAFRAEGAAGVSITLESLQASHPAICVALRAEGATAERNRIQGVQAVALPGYETEIAKMMFDGATSPEQAAIAVVGLEKQSRASQVAGGRTDAAQLATVAALPPPVPAPDAAQMTLEERCKTEYETDATIRADFPTLEAYVAYSRNVAEGRVRVIGAKR